MKTSNKLLFSFVAFIILLMLLSDIVMRANLKSGTENGKMNEPSYHTAALKPFRVLKVESVNNYLLQIVKSDKFEYLGEDSSNSYIQAGDTLYIKLFSNNNAIVHCPEIGHIIVSNASLMLQDLQQPYLTVETGELCNTRLSGVHLGTLDFRGQAENGVDIYDNCEVDSLKLTLGKRSTFRSFDVPYQYTDMKLDSLKELQMNGRSLASMKEIK